MVAGQSHTASGGAEVEELLEQHPEIQNYNWKSHAEEIYVVLDDGKLAGRSFLDDMEDVGMSVEFVDFATSRIGFSRD